MFSSLTEALTTFQIVVVASAATFVVGVIFSQKVKDWLSGVPSDLRSALKNVEADTLGKVKAAQAEVLAKLTGALPQPKVALAPSAAPVAPLAPAPAPLAPVAPVLVPPSEAAPVTPPVA